LTAVSVVRFRYDALMDLVNAHPDTRARFEANLIAMASARI
jgi:hypothetical protein